MDEKFSLEEIKNAVQVCSYMKKNVDNIHAILIGKDFWAELRETLELDKSMDIVGLAVVTTKWIPTSHFLFFGSTLDAIEMRKALDAVMGDGGLKWGEVIKLLENGKNWDREVKLWQTKEE